MLVLQIYGANKVMFYLHPLTNTWIKVSAFKLESKLFTNLQDDFLAVFVCAINIVKLFDSDQAQINRPLRLALLKRTRSILLFPAIVECVDLFLAVHGVSRRRGYR